MPAAQPPPFMGRQQPTPAALVPLLEKHAKLYELHAAHSSTSRVHELGPAAANKAPRASSSTVRTVFGETIDPFVAGPESLLGWRETLAQRREQSLTAALVSEHAELARHMGRQRPPPPVVLDTGALGATNKAGSHEPRRRSSERTPHASRSASARLAPPPQSASSGAVVRQLRAAPPSSDARSRNAHPSPRDRGVTSMSNAAPAALDSDELVDQRGLAMADEALALLIDASRDASDSNSIRGRADESGGRAAVVRAASAAARTFNDRQERFTKSARGLLVAPSGASIHASQRFQEYLACVRRNRCWVPQTHDPFKGVDATPRPPRRTRAPGASWALKESIWAPRGARGPSRDFYETRECLRAMFEHDWGMAIRGHCLAKGIQRSDGLDEWVDADGNGTHDSVDSAREALWAHHHLLYGMFSYYAALLSDRADESGEIPIYDWSFLAYLEFVHDGDLVCEACTMAYLEHLWSQVNAVEVTTDHLDRFNDSRRMVRHEFIEALVRIAIKTYDGGAARGVSNSVSVAEAIDRLCTHLEATLPPPVMQDSNAFRRARCYIPLVDAELQRHQASLHALYRVYARTNINIHDRLQSARRMSVGEWLRLLDHLGLLKTQQISEWGARMTFVWSKIRASNENGTEEAEMRLRNLTFEDFLVRKRSVPCGCVCCEHTVCALPWLRPACAVCPVCAVPCLRCVLCALWVLCLRLRLCARRPQSRHLTKRALVAASTVQWRERAGAFCFPCWRSYLLLGLLSSRQCHVDLCSRTLRARFCVRTAGSVRARGVHPRTANRRYDPNVRRGGRGRISDGPHGRGWRRSNGCWQRTRRSCHS